MGCTCWPRWRKRWMPDVRRWLIKLMNVMVIIIIVIVECATRYAARRDSATTARYRRAHVIVRCGRRVCGRCRCRSGRSASGWDGQGYDGRTCHAHFSLCEPFLLGRLRCLLLDDLMSRRGCNLLVSFPEGHKLGAIRGGGQRWQDAIWVEIGIANLRDLSLIELCGGVGQRARLEIEFSLLLTMSGLVIKVHMGQVPLSRATCITATTTSDIIDNRHELLIPILCIPPLYWDCIGIGRRRNVARLVALSR